jgi:hypothetical protein
MHRLFRVAFALALLAPLPAGAIVGGRPAPAEISPHAALIVSTRGASCTGAVLTLDLLLTAAHCVEPKADYAVAVFEGGAPKLVPIERVVLHPRFDPEHFRARKPTPDLALVKIAGALPLSYRPARLARDVVQPKPGETFTLAGYGMTREGDGKSAGKLHAVTLPAIGNTIDSTGVIMTRLSAGGGRNAGACTGDSGGPVFVGDRHALGLDPRVAAIIGWTTGAKERACGLVTGATLVTPQLEWIAQVAKELGSSIGR